MRHAVQTLAQERADVRRKERRVSAVLSPRLSQRCLLRKWAPRPRRPSRPSTHVRSERENASVSLVIHSERRGVRGCSAPFARAVGVSRRARTWQRESGLDVAQRDALAAAHGRHTKRVGMRGVIAVLRDVVAHEHGVQLVGRPREIASEATRGSHTRLCAGAERTWRRRSGERRKKRGSVCRATANRIGIVVL
eukprot:scaffold305_cov247-Pinguiococcus_pyrenoidosus.AAC.16